jgi:hypothetical protein
MVMHNGAIFDRLLACNQRGYGLGVSPVLRIILVVDAPSRWVSISTVLTLRRLHPTSIPFNRTIFTALNVYF